MQRLNPWLLGLALGHVVLGLLFNAITPIFEAPDEDGHYLFVRYLQVHRRLPVQQLDPLGPRAHHPPLYHLLGALLTAWVPVTGGADRIDMQVNPHVWFRYDDPNTDNKNHWIHYGPEERWPYSGQALVVHLVRGLSLAFSTLGVVCTYYTARGLRPGAEGEALARLATALVAFHPMLLFMSGVLQNNTTMLATGAAVGLALTVGVRRGFSQAHWALVGVLLGVGVLLQLSALVMAAPVGVALLYETWRTRRWRTLVLGGLAVAVPFALLAGWWFLRNRAIYGDWTGNSVVAQMWCCDPIQPLAALKLFLTGLLGRFGQGLMITYPPPVYWAAVVLLLVAVAGWLRPDRAGPVRLGMLGPLPLPGLGAGLGPRAWLRLEWLTPNRALWAVYFVNVLGVGGALVLYAVTVAPGLPGRYFFPAFPSLGVLLAAGWLNWFRPRRRWLGEVFLAGAMLAASLYALFGLLLPTYGTPRTPRAAELRAAVPLDADIGGTARVLGYRLSQARVRPGDTLTLTLYWQPLSRTDVPYTVFVHLLDPALGSLTQRDTYPGGGNYATTVWDEGRVFVDEYRLALPPDTPASPVTFIVFGLYQGETGARLPVTGANAGPPDMAWVEITGVEVAPP